MAVKRAYSGHKVPGFPNLDSFVRALFAMRIIPWENRAPYDAWFIASKRELYGSRIYIFSLNPSALFY